MGIIGPTAPSGPAGGGLEGTYPNPEVTSENLGKRLVADYGFVIKAGLAESATEPYLLTLAGGAPILAVAKVAKFGEAVPGMATLPGVMKIGTRTGELVLYVLAYPSKAIGAVTLTFGIYTVTAFGETVAQQEPTIATPGKATVTLASPPAKFVTAGSSPTPTTAAQNGSFLVGFTTSAVTAAESLLVGKAQVYVQNK